MTEAYNIFPPAQADNLIVYSAYSQYQRAAMAGYFVLTGCIASRTSASEVTVSSGTYSKGGIKTDYAGGSITSISAAAAGKQRVDLFYIDCTDDTLKTLTGSEQTPSLSTNFLENQLPLPPDMTDEDWVIIALARVTEDGITDTAFGTYASGSIANIRFSGTMAADNSTITISNGMISVANHASKHITSGTDEIDGDKLDIDWNPSNYTPSTSPSEADNADNLTAHLYGIDTKLGTLSSGFRYVQFLPQSFFYPASNSADLSEVVGTNTTWCEACFDDTTQEYLQGGFRVPDDYNSSGTVTAYVIGRSVTAAESKNVAFVFEHLPLADSEAIDAAETSSASGDSATDATQGDLEIHSWTVSTPGWAAGDWVNFLLSRNPSATDNLIGDWALMGFVLKVPITR